MTALLYTLGVLAFVFAILASIGIHELGHMIPAKKFGARSPNTSSASARRCGREGGDRMGVEGVPLGGVKIVGMLPPEKHDRAGVPARDEDATCSFANPIPACSASRRDTGATPSGGAVRPEDEPRLFYKMSWWKKVVVMAGRRPPTS